MAARKYVFMRSVQYKDDEPIDLLAGTRASRRSSGRPRAVKSRGAQGVFPQPASFVVAIEVILSLAS